MDKLIRVEGDLRGKPFVAGVVLNNDVCVRAAPILKLSVGRTRSALISNFERRGWKWQEVDPIAADDLCDDMWLVCGGRDFTDEKSLRRILDFTLAVRGRPDRIIHGGAPGADTFADKWAADHGIERVVCLADWAEHGKAAGPIRNREMLERGPSIVIAFPGGRGTADMVRIAREKGLEVAEVKEGVDVRSA